MNKIFFLFLLISSTVYSQIITTFAGNGISTYAGDGGQAVNASFSEPQALAVDAAGNVYIVDEDDNVVRKVNTLGIINTVAGSGNIGYGGDNGPATSAKMVSPSGIALDSSGNIFIADTYNHLIRLVNSSTGIITRFAGVPGFNGYSGDGGLATAAALNLPEGVAVGKNGKVYIADAANHRIRVVDTAGIITTFAGTGVGGYGGDGGLAAAAQFNYPISIVIDTASGKIYIGDYNNNRVRVIDTTGIITTLAGTGVLGYGGDGGASTLALLNKPKGITIDTAGTIYIADSGNSRVRKVNTSGIISTYAGTGVNGFSGDGGPATSAKIFSAPGITVDIAGNLYIAEYYNSRVRKVSFCSSPLNLTISGTFSVCTGDSTALTANGATTYTWSANSVTSSSVEVIPVDTTVYYVTEITGGCIAVDSATVNVISCNVDIEKIRSDKFEIYPNPTNGNLFIPSDENSNARFEIYNSVGEKVLNGQIDRTESQIDISIFSNGIYFVRVIKDNGQVSQSRIIKH